MARFSVTLRNVAVSAAQDLFEVVAPADGEVEICGFTLGQTSDLGDAVAEALQVSWIRGHTVPGSGGSDPQPVPASTRLAATPTVCGTNNSTLASGGTGAVQYGHTWNVQDGITCWWAPEDRPVLRATEMGVLRQSAPADALTISGTLYLLAPAPVAAVGGGDGDGLLWGADTLLWGADSLSWS